MKPTLVQNVIQSIQTAMLYLFISFPNCIGNAKNKSFATEPTAISTMEIANDSFRYDHSPIKFKDGQRHGDNYELAWAAVFDIDNSHSDNPNDWVTREQVSARLKTMELNHWIIASRNHMLEKDGKAARPKFHVYLPFSVPLYDKAKFIAFCEWCIRTFDSDPKVKSPAQVIFGFGDNPNAFGGMWSKGRCVDQILTEDDLIIAKPSLPATQQTANEGQLVPVASPLLQQIDESQSAHVQRYSSGFDWFTSSGEWKKHLGDLEAKGWRFWEKNGVLYVQTPDGDHSPGMQDGNIKDDVGLYLFSKAPSPLEIGQCYSICYFFSVVLFGGAGQEEFAQLAAKYFPDYDGNTVLPEPLVLHPILTSLLEKMQRIDFGNEIKISEKTYQVITIWAVLELVKKNKLGLVEKNEFVYVYNKKFWQVIDKKEVEAFLAAAAIRFGVPKITALHFEFRAKLYKQFICNGYLPTPEESNVVLVNLDDGTYEISETIHGLREHRAEDFLKHLLRFKFDPNAIAPLFMKYLNQVLPEIELQMILAEYIGYVFTFHLKLEKMLILYGSGANGKSVFFEIIFALLGRDFVSCYKLSTITAVKSYERADLQNRLLNYASELNGKLEADTLKQLASGEPIEARCIYKAPFQMTHYAKLMFNANELPKEVENTHAFFRRFLIIPFQQTIPEDKQDKELAQKIIANELPGVFNWVLEGLNRLLKQRKFTDSDIVRQQVEEYKRESDSVAMFLDEMQYVPSIQSTVFVSELYTEYKNFCLSDGYRALGKKNFTKRLRALNFVITKQRGYVVYAQKKPVTFDQLSFNK